MNDKLIIFDLDNTILNGDSDYSWIKFMIDSGNVNCEEYSKKNDYFYEQYYLGELDYHEWALFVLSTFNSFRRCFSQIFVSSHPRVVCMFAFFWKQILANSGDRGSLFPIRKSVFCQWIYVILVECVLMDSLQKGRLHYGGTIVSQNRTGHYEKRTYF